ncbi:MAG: zinc-binding alcohol dehydrogenase [Caldilineaceae bacterium]|nr:zinc-binding alcohol dehydrogenase [Caldilineaceae bacterium]MDE0180598.1 zinc-binding alcohol dehydrogenase [Caldilineaceae bacterium]
MRRRAVLFTAPGAIEVRTEEMAPPQGDELLVETVVSAISAGTEMLFYRGQVPDGMAADASISGLTGAVRYPLKYGYACVGRICAEERGQRTANSRLSGDSSSEKDNRHYFAFHPHESHFCASPQTLVRVPEGIPPPQAALLPNAETAVNLVMDGAPLVGEQVLVMGLGIVGLLTTALLAQFPLAALVAVDPLPHRRRLALRLGASQAIDPSGADGPDLLQEALTDAGERRGVDLIYELSGQPTALDRAVSAAGFDSRIVVGSWYGTKATALQLGGSFHRNRIRLISSQVSSVAPHLRGRWTKARRMESAWQLLAKLPADELISHRFPLEQAAAAYTLIDSCPEQTLQVILNHQTAVDRE